MKPLHEILAKSVNYGNLTLLEHTQHVVLAIELFSKKYNFNFDTTIAVKGAILHDLGKAHPHFQRKIQNINHANIIEEREWNFTHRHEISSLAFLPCFPKPIWDNLIDLVVAHHKSIKDDPRNRGILDLLENDTNFIDKHLKNWEEWRTYGFQILKKFDLPICFIDQQTAKRALEYAITYCETKKNGFSPLRGLLKSADHFASAFMHKTEEKLNSLFEIPNLSYYHSIDRKNWLYPLSEISTDDNRKHTIVVASTGSGKTDFLLRRCKKRIFYTLPFQASINAMWERICETVPNKDIRLLHATSKIVVGKKNLDEQILQPLAGSAIKILTPHQLAAIVFGTAGFEAMMLDVEGADIILDEIHTYSDFSRTMVLEIVKTLLRLNCRIHIGTATMPTVLYKELLTILGGKEQVYEQSLPNEIMDSFDRHQIEKLEDESKVIQILKSAFSNKEKVLVIFNTVDKAQAFFKSILKEFSNIPKMLIHSRFKRGDRVDLETRLKSEFNGDGKKFGNGLMPCIVVSTQVVEVSLDISFDRMITECAPLDGMIQRFGRINRKRSPKTTNSYKPIHVIKPGKSTSPYKREILNASFDQLPANFEVLKERSLQAKIDIVYPVLEIKEIDVHLIYENNDYNIKELTNNRKGVLVDALEIESATCILASDRNKYLIADLEDRLQLEVPINYRLISRHKNKFEQLNVGSFPFIIPQDEDGYNVYGLQLT